NFGTPWVYNTAGAPWQAQATVRRIQNELYQPIPGGQPGNDDLGAMSSWYVWAAIGVYPQTPGTPLLSINSPLFETVIVHAGGGPGVLPAEHAGLVAQRYGRAADRGVRDGHAPGDRRWLVLECAGNRDLARGFRHARAHRRAGDGDRRRARRRHHRDHGDRARG